MTERIWVRGDDAKHLAWGNEPTETLCYRKLGGEVKRYGMGEANCDDCRNAFMLANFSLLGRSPLGSVKEGE
jgi:hypothetical protein